MTWNFELDTEESAPIHIMMRVRDLNPKFQSEIELVASRMRATLVEVLGEERGTSLYSMQWLKDRVLWHLDPQRVARVLLAEIGDAIVGHAIVRVDTEGNETFGYFSTIYVLPEFRGQGVAKTLIQKVENWCTEKKLPYIIYNTAENNYRLIELFGRLGFEVTFRESEMVQLKKILKAISRFP